MTTTGLLVRKEFRGGGRPPSSREPITVANFRSSIGGHRIGPSSAAVTVVEFSDFECPFCRVFADSTWPSISKRFPTEVALVYRHYPLPMHRNAYPAARASECAAEQGKFAAFHDVVFKNQERLGIMPYSQLAADAGISSLRDFEACSARAGKVPAIEADIAAARQLGLNGTPTIIVNDKRFPSNPTREELIALIEKELKNQRYH